MQLTLSHCFVYVLDQDEALDFYTRVLGFEKRSDAQMEHMRWLTVGPREQPEIEINLMAIGPPLPPEDHERLRQLVAKGSMGAIIFTTDDCRGWFERVVVAGAEVMQEPMQQSYGVIDCAFRDPSDNHVRISQHVSPG
jgi:predicted enzyme related to lactoylglutathione lyase